MKTKLSVKVYSPAPNSRAKKEKINLENLNKFNNLAKQIREKTIGVQHRKGVILSENSFTKTLVRYLYLYSISNNIIELPSTINVWRYGLMV